MKKPIIGIPGSIYKRQDAYEPVAMRYVNDSYCKAIAANGGIPLILPYIADKEDMSQIMNICNGLLFSGGLDVDPKLYNDDVHAECGTVDSVLDEQWIAIEKMAEERKLPLLGICRGMQLVNVSRGGSLYQDLSEFDHKHLMHWQRQEREYLIHPVNIRQDSVLGSILGVTKIYTNSLHHQCIKQPAADLTVTAYAADSIPEAMESEDGRIILVQWHPEELIESQPSMNRIFKYLVEQSAHSQR